jgi:hypothetical protein
MVGPLRRHKPLTLPNWLPPLVAERARELHQQALRLEEPDEAAMIVQHASDPRMEGVWRYLFQKTRERPKRPDRTAKYKHSAHDPDPSGPFRSDRFPSRIEWRQQVAADRLFSLMIRLARSSPLVPGRRHTYYAWKAEQFRDEAAKILEEFNDRRIDRCTPERERCGRALRKVADAADFLADAEAADATKQTPVIVMTQIAKALEIYFGKRMDGQTATIASVVLAVELTADDAREAARGVWGKAPRKRA